MKIGALLKRYFLQAYEGNDCSIRFGTCSIIEENGFLLFQLDTTKAIHLWKHDNSKTWNSWSTTISYATTHFYANLSEYRNKMIKDSML